MAAEDAKAAVVAGVGPGLGLSVARRFAQAGYQVAMLARDAERLAGFAEGAGDLPGALVPIATDLMDTGAIAAAFARIDAELPPLAACVFNAGAFVRGSVLDLDVAEVERCWRIGTLAGFAVGQAAARRMVAAGAGTILFTGATASLRGGANFLNLAAPKFGLRATAQSFARELGPKGVHVAHILIDGQILSDRYRHLLDDRGPDSLLDPEAIAETYWHLHIQDRSAWTHELDLRPWVERF